MDKLIAAATAAAPGAGALAAGATGAAGALCIAKDSRKVEGGGGIEDHG